MRNTNKKLAFVPKKQAVRKSATDKPKAVGRAIRKTIEAKKAENKQFPPALLTQIKVRKGEKLVVISDTEAETVYV